MLLALMKGRSGDITRFIHSCVQIYLKYTKIDGCGINIDKNNIIYRKADNK